ncbi:hypothetical protein FRC09_013415, partial [Ceratobasidium sp. 395]
MDKYLSKCKSTTASQALKPERTATSTSSSTTRYHPYSQPKQTGRPASASTSSGKLSGSS